MSTSSQYVTLVSEDDFRFIIPRSAAEGSGFLRDTLDSDFIETTTGVVQLAEHRAEIVEKVAEYLMYKERYTGSRDEPPDFQDRVKPEIALEL